MSEEVFTHIRTAPTGHMTEVSSADRTPAYDPRSGDHLWVLVAHFKINPEESRKGILDHENLLGIGGPGCYFCEQLYTPRLSKRRCPGEPK